MDKISSRVAKVLVGACLIVIPLMFDSATLGYGVLLPLIAVPMVFSGMFDWRPMEYAIAWLSKTVKLSPDEIKFTPKRA